MVGCRLSPTVGEYTIALSWSKKIPDLQDNLLLQDSMIPGDGFILVENYL
ncbi:hypothetical protein H6G36_28235 [Anabaena minutissima FACHB-250]|nr:hypothetical protein [Anabaena minutissima FACHB-250]